MYSRGHNGFPCARNGSPLSMWQHMRPHAGRQPYLNGESGRVRPGNDCAGARETTAPFGGQSATLSAGRQESLSLGKSWIDKRAEMTDNSLGGDRCNT